MFNVMNMRPVHKQNGFTLIELLMTMILVGILAVFATPSFDTLITRNRQYAEFNNFLAGLSAARSEAVKRGLRTVICTSSDSASCDDSVDWDSGWIVFVDEDVDGEPDAATDIIRVGASLRDGYTIVGSSNIDNMLRYDSNGDALDTGFFTVCDPRGADDAMAIIISVAGSARQSSVNSSGGVLTCS